MGTIQPRDTALHIWIFVAVLGGVLVLDVLRLGGVFPVRVLRTLSHTPAARGHTAQMSKSPGLFLYRYQMIFASYQVAHGQHF